MKKTAQKGQALLIILLIMATILTVAISVVSRSVTDIAISQKEDEATRAFSAAEAGIERALIGDCTQIGGECTVSGSFSQADSTFQAKVTGLATASKTFLLPIELSSGETVPVWFVSHAQDQSLTCSGGATCFTGSKLMVCWGEPGTSPSTAFTPALELSILYTTNPGDYSTAQIARGAYDPYSTRVPANSFASASLAGCTIDGKSFAFSKTVSLVDAVTNADDQLQVPASARTRANGLQQARLRLLYNSDRAHALGLSVNFPENNDSNLPNQGSKIESTGTAGEAQRRIEVFQLFSDLPPIFDFGVFSGGGLTK